MAASTTDVPEDQDPQFHDVVLLALVADGLPDHCIHGRTTCVVCHEWCWLGPSSLKLLRTTTTLPVCKPCAVKHIPADKTPAGNVEDHLVVDGPHD